MSNFAVGHLCRGQVVEAQHAAEALTLTNCHVSCQTWRCRLRKPIAETLVSALTTIWTTNSATARRNEAIRSRHSSFELPSDQLPVPAQQRIRRHDRAEVKQNLARDAKSFARQQRTFSIQESEVSAL